jgi:hypothetical protein
MEGGPDPYIAAGTREMVRKKRMEDIKTRLGRDNLIYNSIRATNIQATRATSLLDSPPPQNGAGGGGYD